MFCLYFLPGPAQEMFIKLFILHIFVSNTVPNVDPEIKISNFYFAFLIDKIDNIITYSPYTLYYVTRTCLIQTKVTWPVYCTAIGWSSGDVIRTYWLYEIILSNISIKMQNKIFLYTIGAHLRAKLSVCLSLK